MKIIQLIQKQQLRGAEIFASQLSNHLLESGHEVIVVSVFPGDAKIPFKGNKIDLNRSPVQRFYDIRGWKKFSEIVKEHEPDIVQANASDTLKFAASSKFLFKWKTPLVYRNANKMGDFINSRPKWYLNSFYLSQVSYVVSVSRECEKDFIQTFNFPNEKIETVEIGVEDQEFGKIPKDLQDIFKSGPVIVHIGGFVPEKNHKGLINIFNGVLNNFPDAQLLLLGKGKLQSDIKQKVNTLNIGDNVHFLNYRNDVLEILFHSKAFVLPSSIEGLPAVILESMYCETPVVAYNVGGIGEVVISGKTGWLLQKGDEAGFKTALENILSEDSDVAIKTKNAKKMISEKFLNAQIARRFFRVYQTSLNQ